MNFIVNNVSWTLYEKPVKEIVDMYNSDHEQKVTYLFGASRLDYNEVWIAKEQTKESKLKTLAHELTHIYLWHHGMGYINDFQEETVCEIISSCHRFVTETVNKYEDEMYNRAIDNATPTEIDYVDYPKQIKDSFKNDNKKQNKNKRAR